jgi:hypothetical protein
VEPSSFVRAVIAAGRSIPVAHGRGPTYLVLTSQGSIRCAIASPSIDIEQLPRIRRAAGKVVNGQKRGDQGKVTDPDQPTDLGGAADVQCGPDDDGEE